MLAVKFTKEVEIMTAMKTEHVQGRSKVFITGQARINPEDYVIKCVGGR